VVGFAPGCRCGAVFGAAVLVAQSHGFALRRAVEAAGAAEVKVFEEGAEGLAEESWCGIRSCSPLSASGCFLGEV
jgi:hypothetical protein